MATHKEVLKYSELSDQITCDYAQDFSGNSHETTTVPIDKYNQEVNNEETELKCEAPCKSTRSKVTPLDDNDDASITRESHEIVHPEDIPSEELPQIPQNGVEKGYSGLMGEKHTQDVLKTEHKFNLFRESDHKNIHHPSEEESIHLRNQIQLLEKERDRLYAEKGDVENNQVSTQKKFNELEEERNVLAQREQTQIFEIRRQNELIANLKVDAEIAEANQTKAKEKIFQLTDEIKKLRAKMNLNVTAMSKIEENLRSRIQELENNKSELSTYLNGMETKVHHLEEIKRSFESTQTIEKLSGRTPSFRAKLLKDYEHQSKCIQNPSSTSPYQDAKGLSFSVNVTVEEVDIEKRVEKKKKKKHYTQTQLDKIIDGINPSNAFECISEVHGKPWTYKQILVNCCDIIVDGSNVGYAHGQSKNIGKEGKSYFSYDGIPLCVEQLQSFGYTVTLVTLPASRLLTGINYSKLEKYENILERTQDGPAEDLVLLKKAIETVENGKVPLLISNDNFSEFDRKSTRTKQVPSFPFDFRGTPIMRPIKYKFNGDKFTCGLMKESKEEDKERPKLMLLPRSSRQEESHGTLGVSESNGHILEEQDIQPAAISLKKMELTKRSAGNGTVSRLYGEAESNQPRREDIKEAGGNWGEGGAWGGHWEPD